MDTWQALPCIGSESTRELRSEEDVTPGGGRCEHLLEGSGFFPGLIVQYLAEKQSLSFVLPNAFLAADPGSLTIPCALGSAWPWHSGWGSGSGRWMVLHKPGDTVSRVALAPLKPSSYDSGTAEGWLCYAPAHLCPPLALPPLGPSVSSAQGFLVNFWCIQDERRCLV